MPQEMSPFQLQKLQRDHKELKTAHRRSTVDRDTYRSALQTALTLVQMDTVDLGELEITLKEGLGIETQTSA